MEDEVKEEAPQADSENFGEEKSDNVDAAPKENSGSGDAEDDREMHKTICTECGKECEVPFEPTEGKPVFCKDCYMAKRPKRRFNKFRGPREMHDAKCSDCGKDCQVPFKPSGDKPVRCKECYIKMKESETNAVAQ